MNLTLPDLNDPSVLGAGGIALLVVLWLVWAIARRIVRIGFFVLAFLAGTAIAAAASAALNRPQPLPVLAAEGLAFAWAWSLFRAKVARVVSAVMLLAAVKLGLTLIPDMVQNPSKIPDLSGGVLKEGKPVKKPGPDKVQHSSKT